MSFGSLAHTLKTKILSANRALDTKAGLAAPDPAMLAMFGVVPSVSGASVTPQSAMRVPAVAAAVGLISSTIGTLPAKVFTKQDEGGKSPAPEHSAYSLVHDDANEWTSAAQLRNHLTTDALLCGNGYAFANRVNGKVQELIRLSPFKIGDNVVAFGRHADLGSYLLVRNGLSRFFVISEASYVRFVDEIQSPT